MITFDQKIAELLNNWQPGGWPWGNLILCAIALVLSIILCGAIGLERERRGRTAGLRTHLLVGVGSCIIMIISIYGFPALFFDRDVARLAAQVVAGVGFLGAGAIIHKTSGARGLTTAGTIWIVMAIGLACGSFNFIIAAVGTLIILAVLVSFRKLESKINDKNPMIIMVVDPEKPAIKTILKVASEFHCTIHGLSTNIESEEEGIEIIFQARFDAAKPVESTEFVAKLEEKLQPKSIQLINHK